MAGAEGLDANEPDAGSDPTDDAGAASEPGDGPLHEGDASDTSGTDAPDESAAVSEDASERAPRTGLARVLLGPGRRTSGPRAHPYADEPVGEKERTLDPRRVALFWFGLASILAVGGVLLQMRYGYITNQTTRADWWENATLWPLFIGLALLGFGFVRKPWAKRFTMVGWILFAGYWGLTAMDLFVKEGADYVNLTFALIGVYFFVWLAYHEWLSMDRRVDNHAIRFLNVVAFLAAGTYFLVDKIAPLRVGLIRVVGDHTKWGLDLFGQGDKAGLRFAIDPQDTRGPVTFHYPETVYHCPDGTYVPDKPAPEGLTGEALWEHQAAQCTVPGDGWLDQALFYSPGGEHIAILPVSIILACTAIQSIMLFVGLVAGTDASWKRKLAAAGIVAAVVYVLNLVRNVGIIWFYGQGHASFWVMHNAIGKGGSLIAMLGIAVVMFRYFPELLKSLFGVLDLKDRDGPIERALKLGREREDPPQDGDPRAEAHREKTWQATAAS